MNTGKRRSFDATPRKCGALPGKLVKWEKTPEKDGETPRKRGEPIFCVKLILPRKGLYGFFYWFNFIIQSAVLKKSIIVLVY